MMTHYINLKVVPDPETTAAQILGVLYNKLHLQLVEMQATDIAVSFPDYSKNPLGVGNVLRLCSSDERLKKLLSQDWLKGVRDHVRLSEILPIPDEAEHRRFWRKQPKTNVGRLRRRRMKRKNESYEQAKEAIPSTVERKPNLPYVHLRSLSSKQNYCLFLELGRSQESVEGKFNSYGLSTEATTPWF